MLMIFRKWYIKTETFPDTDKVAKMLTDFLLLMLEQFPELSLLRFTIFIAESISAQSPHSPHLKLYELFPHLLNQLSTHDSLISPSLHPNRFQEINNSNSHVAEAEMNGWNSISGVAFKADILNGLMRVKWNLKYTIAMAGVLKDVIMDRGQLKSAVEKLTGFLKFSGSIDDSVRRVDELSLSEIPPLIYQLLHLARTKEGKPGFPDIAIHHIASFFANANERLEFQMAQNQLSKTEKEEVMRRMQELAETEGTVLVHVATAVQKDFRLGQAFQEYMKEGKMEYLKPFNVSLILAMARISHWEDWCFTFLKSQINQAITFQKRLENAGWARGLTGFQKVELDHLFETILTKSARGWEQVSPSIVKLGLLLLDGIKDNSPSFFTQQKKRKFYISGLSVLAETSLPLRKYSVTSNDMELYDFGRKLLLEIFKSQSISRLEILNQIISRIIAKENSGVFLDTLECIITELPSMVADYVNVFKDCIDLIVQVPIAMAFKLWKCFSVVAVLHAGFRNNLMLTLKKGIFMKEVTARENCLVGCLLLLQTTFSQSSGGVPASSNFCGSPSTAIGGLAGTTSISPSQTPTPSPLQLELLTLLRRTLSSQQPELRLRLYQSLHKILLVKQFQYLAPAVYDILYPHFLKIFEGNENVKCPVKVYIGTETSEPTEDAGKLNVKVLEPVPWLLKLVSQLLLILCPTKASGFGASAFVKGKSRAQFSNPDEASETVYSTPISIQNGRSAMESVLSRLQDATLEDFEMDKSMIVGFSDDQATKNYVRSLVVSGCYEAMIEYILITRLHMHNADPKNNDEAAFAIIVHLFNKMHAMHNLVREKFNAAATKKTKVAPPHIESTIMSLSTISRLLKYMVSTIQFDNADDKSLSTELSLLKYLMTRALGALTCAATDNNIDMELYEDCVSLAEIYLQSFLKKESIFAATVVSGGGKKEKGRTLLTLSIESFQRIVDIIVQKYPKKLNPFFQNLDISTAAAEFIENITFSSSQEGSSSNLSYLDRQIQVLKKLASSLLLDDTNDSVLIKESTATLNIIQVLAMEYTKTEDARIETETNNGVVLSHLVNWLEKLCKVQIDEKEFVKIVVGLLLTLTRNEAELDKLFKVAQGVHEHLGNAIAIDDDENMDEYSGMSIIDNRTVAVVSDVLLSNIGTLLEEVKMFLQKLHEKCNLMQKHRDDYVPESQITFSQFSGTGNRLSKRIYHILLALIEIISSKLPQSTFDKVLIYLNSSFEVINLLLDYKLKETSTNSRVDKNTHDLIELVKVQICPKFSELLTSRDHAKYDGNQKGKGKRAMKGKGKGTKGIATGKVVLDKESKLVPMVRKRIEQFSSKLGQLSKISNKDYLSTFKLLNVRDIKFDKAILEQQEEEESEAEEEEDLKKHSRNESDNEVENQPRTKKLRRN
ncbi:FANCI solenoid 4-domain-containing protein [Paraphysoderma sedebokerense]|nr:FANCI solenoid 4-domain-containing protein [Paraphysoderma sedebokerense]